MSRIAEYELRLDWVRIDNVSEGSDDSVGEVYGSIVLDDATLWRPTVGNIFGGTHATYLSMRAGEFFKFPESRSSRRHFDEDAPQQSVAFHLKINLSESDEWNADDIIARVNEEIRPNPTDFTGKQSLTTEKTASSDGRITYQYTLTRLG
ncbi:hypothetical protein GCM10018785_42270 [Streptomyces longispororuber]|uniref:Uncharacterized protein n=1 Tax=Streptomyces longispororuber TaxID=68230 RepID=A0A919DPP9_9ACTN|nr:hypothetical protein [Streptomyces longispororuber]GHE69275.1 hypothetical protein GCM10018785_42270 [Streptomyces longispororuber]